MGVWGGVAGAPMGKVSLQAEAEGPHRGENATWRAEAGDAAWGGGSQSSRGHEGAWAPRCCLGMHEGGGRGRFQEGPRVSLELWPRYSIG